MRNTRAGIKLFAEDGIRVIRQLKSTGEANDLLASKQAEWHMDGRGYTIGLKLVSRGDFAFGGDSFRTNGLSASVMEHNALGTVMPKSRKSGFNQSGTRDEEILGNFTDYAMSLVEEWPEVRDTKAVTV